MFPFRYFNPRYWAARFWAKIGAAAAVVLAPPERSFPVNPETRVRSVSREVREFAAYAEKRSFQA
jgi:hypothetical protein